MRAAYTALPAITRGVPQRRGDNAAHDIRGQGKLTQHFAVGAPCTVRQVRVELWNEGGAVVDSKLLDVDPRYGS